MPSWSSRFRGGSRVQNLRIVTARGRQSFRWNLPPDRRNASATDGYPTPSPRGGDFSCDAGGGRKVGRKQNTLKADLFHGTTLVVILTRKRESRRQMSILSLRAVRVEPRNLQNQQTILNSCLAHAHLFGTSLQ